MPSLTLPRWNPFAMLAHADGITHGAVARQARPKLLIGKIANRPNCPYPSQVSDLRFVS